MEGSDLIMAIVDRPFMPSNKSVRVITRPPLEMEITRKGHSQNAQRSFTDGLSPFFFQVWGNVNSG